MSTDHAPGPDVTNTPLNKGDGEGPTTPPRQRQRMGGYTPLENAAPAIRDTQEPEPTAPLSDPEPAALPAPPQQTPVQAAGARPSLANPREGQKQRMSRAPRMGAQGAAGETTTATAPVPSTPPGPAAGGGRQRMGSAVPREPVVSGAGQDAEPAAKLPAESRKPNRDAEGAANPGSRLPKTPAATAPRPARTEDTARGAWTRRALIVLGLVAAAVALVLAARWMRTLPAVLDFLQTYSGHTALAPDAPRGLPAWLGWQHFLNMFFIVLIVRTGLQVRREKRAPGYWKPKENSFFSPKGNTPKKVSLSQWLHQVLDILWVVNGAVFIVLLAITGHWQRIVPTSWDIFPNMVSAAIQYASLDWPLENGWVHYNALQMAAYFLTVYIAAPLAILSGLRMSTWWPVKARLLNKVYPLEAARAMHFPVMLYFVAFTVAHVFLVFFTGALRNLNHMYTSRDAADWWGLGIFALSLTVIAGAWFLTKPVFTTPLATRMGTVTKN